MNDQFKITEKHRHIAIVYENSFTIKNKIISSMEAHPNCEYVIPNLDNKTEGRLRGLYDSTARFGNTTYHFQSTGVKPMFEMNSVSDQIRAALGDGHMIGYYVCQSCLKNAIMSCEEQL